MNADILGLFICFGAVLLLIGIHVVTWHFSDVEIEVLKRQRFCLIVAGLAFFAAMLWLQDVRPVGGCLLGAAIMFGVHLVNVLEWLDMARMSRAELRIYLAEPEESSRQYQAHGM